METIVYYAALVVVPSAIMIWNITLAHRLQYFERGDRVNFLYETQWLAMHDGASVSDIMGKVRLDPHGRLFQLTAILLTQLFGLSFPVFMAVPSLFLAIFAFAIGVLGRQVGSVRTGILAMMLGVLAPDVFAHGQVYNIDLSVSAMSLLTFVVLRTTHEFRRPIRILLTGALLGVSLVAKITAFGYLAPVFAFHIVRGVRRPSPDGLKGSTHRVAWIVAMLAVAALIFVPMMRHFLIDLFKDLFSHLERPDAAYIPQNRTNSNLVLILFLMGPALTLAFAAALPTLVRRRFRSCMDVLIFAGVPLLFFLARPTGMERYLLAPIGGLAVLAAHGLIADPKHIKAERRRDRRVEGPALLTLAALSFTYLPVAAHPPAAIVDRQISMVPPQVTLDNAPELMDELRAEFDRRGHPLVFFITQYPTDFDSRAERFAALLRLADPQIRLFAMAVARMPIPRYRILPEAFAQSDLFLYLSASPESDWPRTILWPPHSARTIKSPEERAIREQFLTQVVAPARPEFRLWKQFPIHKWHENEGTLYVYERIKPHPRR